MSDNPRRHAPTSETSPYWSSSPHTKRRALSRRSAVALAVICLGGTTVGVALATGTAQATPPAFLSQFSNVVPGPSTVPTNGDVNPYGIVVVPQSTGAL